MQDPATAEPPEMPRSAIETGAVDRVLALKVVAPALVEMVQGWRADERPV